MQCFSPMSIKKPESNSSKERITVPCGKCVACLSRKRQEWSFRLQKEASKSKSAVFITLTYNDVYMPLNSHAGLCVATLCKQDIQLFMKRLRKEVAKITDNKIRYYIVGEYGPKSLRPHYHGLLFNLPYTDRRSEVKLKNLILTCWQKKGESMGYVMMGTVTEASIGYVTKYLITAEKEVYGKEPEFALMSRKPGIGQGYLSEQVVAFHKNPQEKRFYCVLSGGNKTAIPRYYSDKIFSKNEKKQHLEQLQKNQDNRINKEIEEISKKENYFSRELENKKQKEQVLKTRLTKNSKL